MAHRTTSRVPGAAEPPSDAAAAAARWVGKLPVVAGATAALLGVVAIEAYIFGAGPPQSISFLLPPTPPLAALMFVLTGAGLLALKGNLVKQQLFAASLAVLIAFLVLAEYLIWRDLGLDMLLFPDDVSRVGSAFPGRSSS